MATAGPSTSSKLSTTAETQEKSADTEKATPTRDSPTKSEQSGSLEDEEEDNISLTGPNATRDAIADGIVSLLSPTLKTLDQGVLATKRSQEELSEQIALLTDQLKIIQAEQVCPIDLDGYVNRLGIIKGKINVISSVLHTAQDRLNKVHDQAVKEAARRKPLIEPSPISTARVSTRPDQTETFEEADNNQNPPTSEDNRQLQRESPSDTTSTSS